jgi:hypothetical protein
MEPEGHCRYRGQYEPPTMLCNIYLKFYLMLFPHVRLGPGNGLIVQVFKLKCCVHVCLLYVLPTSIALIHFSDV